MQQSALHGFLRIRFPNGLTAFANVIADEMVGRVFIMMCILAATQQGKTALSHFPNIAPGRLKQMMFVFEKVFGSCNDSNYSNDLGH
jgi:hypothetical protein